MSKIPKVVFQTGTKRPPGYVVQQIRSKIPDDWKYLHFVDDEVIQFFRDNPLEEFPSVIERYHGIRVGAHKADLFRYYYLYVNGGVYFDTDVMLKENITDIIKDYGFVTVLGTMFPTTVFNGFLCASAQNTIIYKALENICFCNLDELTRNYFYSCSYLYKLVTEYEYDCPLYLYKEDYHTDRSLQIVDESKTVYFYHYWNGKRIPRSERIYFAKYFLRKELWILARYHAIRLLDR